MEVNPNTSEMIDVSIDGNDGDIDVPDSRTKSKSKAKPKSAKGKKQASVAEFKEAVAEPKIAEPKADERKVEEIHVVCDLPKENITEEKTSETAEPKQKETVVIEMINEPKAQEQAMEVFNEPKEVIQEEKKESELVFLLKKYLSDASLTKEFSFKLDTKMTECFMFILCTYPDELDGFNKLIKIILDDNRIDIEDLPEVVRICSKMHSLVSKTNLNMDYKTVIECSRLILKFSIRVLIFEKKINLENENLVGFLKGFDELVDVCLDMLIESKALEKGCISFFKKLMCKNK